MTAGLLSAAMTLAAAAQDWKPDRRVEIVLGTGAGEGGLNRTARLIREWLVNKDKVPSSSIVLNKPGGGHALALAYTAGHEGSANYIQLVNTPLITNNILGRSPITYEQFTPIALLYDEDVVFTVAKDSKIKDAKDLLARLKADPSSIVFSTATGLGTVQHIATLELAKSAGVDLKSGVLKTVNFSSGNAEAITAALGGRIDVVVSSPQPVRPFVESGDMRPIAIASEKRAAGFLADTPTWKELGVDAVITAWRAFVAPKGLTPEQVRFWNDTLAELAASPEWAAEIKDTDANVRYLDSEATAEFFRHETERYSDVYESLGLQAKAAK
ncbi:MAG: tripartite tricarboxylate transporter substrate binding protein [Phyllobacterium sp.]